jgi:phosphonate transport system substrate-binding protein
MRNRSVSRNPHDKEFPMPSRRWFHAGLLALGLVPALALNDPATAQAPKPTLVFTAIPDEDETRLVERFTLYAKYFEEKLGIPVKYLPVKSYPAAVTAFTNGQVQFGWFGGLTGVQARLSVPGSDAIAQGAEDPVFKSYFIANVASGLQPGSQPKAKRSRSDRGRRPRAACSRNRSSARRRARRPMPSSPASATRVTTPRPSSSSSPARSRSAC